MPRSPSCGAGRDCARAADQGRCNADVQMQAERAAHPWMGGHGSDDFEVGLPGASRRVYSL